MTEIDLAYPIGRFQRPPHIDDALREGFISEIAGAPAALSNAVRGLTDDRLDAPYRPNGWTIRQVVHHLPDSHMNAYVRFKLALTESEPTIRPYDEALWAKLPDAAAGPIGLSLSLLVCVHDRWLACIRELPAAAFGRTFHHPESGTMSLNEQLAFYAWHGKHHTAHITSLIERMGWSKEDR
jgi:uncharacterized damage-inducible protein DinB